MNERLIKVGGIAIGAFVVLILLLFLVSSCSKTTPKFDKINEKMVEVAKNYYKNHPEELPQEDKDTKTYALSKMIEEGKIGDPSNEETTCSGEVTIVNNNGNYLYTPFLKCGKEHEDMLLSDKLINEHLVKEGNGLYQIGNSYVFRGDVNNNYLELFGEVFRILRINEDGTIRVLQTKNNSKLEAVTWDNRYNEARKNSEGYNDYFINSISSRLKETMENAYKNDAIISKDIKPYLATHDLCYGKRSTADSSKDGSAECSIKVSGVPIDTISVNEYLTVSLDSNCVRTTDMSCKNYNFLSSYKSSFWTVTADAETTHKAFSISSSIPRLSPCNTAIKVYLTYNLDERIIYVEGDGTKESPYKIFETKEAK